MKHLGHPAVSLSSVWAGVFLLAASGCAAGRAAGPAVSAEPASGGATESIYRAALAWFDRAEADVDGLVPAAEQAADRIIAGGTLWVGGNGGFCDEMFFRAGGFPFAKVWDGRRLGPNDVLFIAQFQPSDPAPFWAQLSGFLRSSPRLTQGKTLLVHFASHDWPSVKALLPMVDRGWWGDRLCLVDTHAPAGASQREIALGQMATTAMAWAFCGEMISAATRKGKTLATWASSSEPGGNAWDKSVEGHNLHPKYLVPPVPAGRIGKEYLRICRRQAADFLKTQPGQVRLAAQRLADCMARGGAAWIVCNGHIHAQGSRVPLELPRMVNFGREYLWQHCRDRIPKGDSLVWMGYIGYPKESIEPALKQGASAVVFCVDEGPNDPRVVTIRGCWDKWDTVISLENYPIRALPASGVVQTLQWYSLMAETIEASKGGP